MVLIVRGHMITTIVDSLNMKKKHHKREVFLKRVGARIRKIRKEKGFSQESLALAAGIDRSYIGGVERGERNIAIINIKRIAEALNTSVHELMKDI